MSFFKRKWVAIVIAFIVIVSATNSGATASMERASREVEELFYSGVEVDGYLHPSIYSQLQKRCDAANGLISLGRKYDLSTESDALAEAREYVGYSSSPSGYYYNDVDLETAFDALCAKLSECELADRDREMMDEYVSTFDNAARVIADSGYNDAVREFYRDVVYQFPAEWFYDNLYIETPSYFGTMWY